MSLISVLKADSLLYRLNYFRMSTYFKLRKHLIETLLFPLVDYCFLVFIDISGELYLKLSVFKGKPELMHIILITPDVGHHCKPQKLCILNCVLRFSGPANGSIVTGQGLKCSFRVFI